MYTFIKAIGRPVGSDGIWDNVDIENYTARELPVHFKEIVFTLSHELHPDVLLSCKLSDIVSRLQGSEGTFVEWLSNLGNKSLPTEKGEYEIIKKKVYRKDLVKAGYQMIPVSATGSLDEPDKSKEFKTHVFLKKEGVDPMDFFKNCMVSVNGFYHYVDASVDGIWISGAMSTINRCKHNHMSVLSFKEVGGIKAIPITEKMIYKQEEDNPLFDKCFLHLGKDVNLDNKTIILVIGGFMHVMDWLTFRRIGDHGLRIDLKNTPYLERLYESIDKLDLRSLDFIEGWYPQHLDYSQVTSDEFIKKYLTLSQSFIVLINNPDIYLEKHELETIPLPGRYISHVKADYPMFVQYGKAGEYWDIEDHGQWLLTLVDAPYKNYIFNKANLKDMISVEDKKVPSYRTSFADAYLLEMGSYQIKKKNKSR